MMMNHVLRSNFVSHLRRLQLLQPLQQRFFRSVRKSGVRSNISTTSTCTTYNTNNSFSAKNRKWCSSKATSEVDSVANDNNNVVVDQHSLPSRYTVLPEFRDLWKCQDLSHFDTFSLTGNKEQRKQLLQQTIRDRPKFQGHVFFLGCGAVALCCLDLFDRIVDVPWANVTIIEALPLKSKVENFIKKGVTFIQHTVTESNYSSFFDKLMKKGDMMIDLSVDSGSLDFMKWCSDRGVFYINSSVEAWHEEDPAMFDPVRQCQFHEFDATELWKLNARKTNPSSDTTIIYGLGANPGLVNLFVKKNLQDLACYYLQKNDKETTIAKHINLSLKQQRFNHLSQQLGVKAIHISENDTQVTAPEDNKRPGECVNTWSIDGMYYECVFLNSEVGWGTHEEALPEDARYIDIDQSRGLSHVILLPVKGKDASLKTWGPGVGEFVAYAITHEENYEITKDLTVIKNNKVVYRPTCNFAYRPSHACLESLKEISRIPGFHLQPERRILTDDIIKGSDILGVLTMGHHYNAWWTGSLLDIHETRELVGSNHNATTLQVATGVMSGVSWIIKNPRRGILSSTDLPHDEVLPTSYAFLGPFVSIPVGWRPTTTTNGQQEHNYEDEKCWQFESFTLYDKE